MEEATESLLLEKSYQISYELFRNAFTAFQKRFVYPKTYLVMAVLATVAGIYAYFVINGSEQDRPVYCMVIVICLMLCAFQWYNPRKIRRNLMIAVREIEQDCYRLRLYPDYLEIGTLLPPEQNELAGDDDLFDDAPEEDFSGTRIYHNKNLHVIEYPDFFMIYQTKTMFYAVPKTVFSEQEREIIRVHFSRKLGKNFRQN